MNADTKYINLEAKYTTEAFQIPQLNEDEAFQIASEKARADEFRVIFKYYHQWQQQAEAKKQAENDAIKNGSILKTGFDLLDKHIRIFGKRLLFILGRSGAGKTSLMAQMIRQQLLDDKRVLVFSCEEAGEDFITRIAINDKLEGIMFTHFVMCDKGNVSLDDVKLSVLKMDLMGISPDVVYIDQLNKIQPETGFRGTKHEKIVHISEQLQNLVKIVNRPVIILHQLNRATESNDGFSTQANVADADAVFNEAQVMLFIESHDYSEWAKTKDPYRDTFQTYINVGKNRSVGGWVGSQFCYFNRTTGRFMTEAEYNEQQALNEFNEF